MKTNGLFNECTLTAEAPIISGRTQCGMHIYADERDVEKGFQLFRKYRIRVFDDGTEVPGHGFCQRSQIIRLPLFDFGCLSEWLRLQKICNLFQSNPKLRPALAQLESVCPERLASVQSQYPSFQQI